MRIKLLVVMLVLSGFISFNMAQSDDVFIETSLFSVYELKPGLTAIVSNISDDDSRISSFDEIFIDMNEQENFREEFFNYIYENKAPVSTSAYDTTGIYRLVYSPKLETKFRNMMNKEYYVYGTKGMESKSVKDIIFALDECITNIYAFTVDRFNNETNGYPVIASDKRLDLNYNGNYREVEDKINSYYKNLNEDYTDNIPAKVFANMGSVYFTYSDDFMWNESFSNESQKCFFPTRGIFRVDADNTVTPVWIDGLDLYGIPCD